MKTVSSGIILLKLVLDCRDINKLYPLKKINKYNYTNLL